MPRSFAVTWDYRCPFARNAHEYLLAGLDDGAEWDVHFVPFSLDQVHVAEGEPDVWDQPADAPGLGALEVGVAVRDRWPEAFLRTHRALFAARHESGLDIRDASVLRGVLAEQGLDADSVFEEIASGRPLDAIRNEHLEASRVNRVWGVPTFIADGQAVFVRLMNRPDSTAEGRRTVERVLDLLTGWTELNEFKHTSIPR